MNTSKTEAEDPPLLRGTISVKNNRFSINTHPKYELENADQVNQPTITLSEKHSELLAKTVQDFLRQKARLYHSPPNDEHITLDGSTICHLNANGGSSHFTDGVITSDSQNILKDELDERELNQFRDVAPHQCAVPVSCYKDGILPDTPLCTFCESKAEKLGLIASIKGVTKRPGSRTQPCPECEDPLRQGTTFNDIPIITHIDSRDREKGCLLDGSEERPGRHISNFMTDEQINNFTHKQLGVDQLSSLHKEPHNLDLNVPPEIAEEINLSWYNWGSISDFGKRIAVKKLLQAESDNKHIPESCITISTDELPQPLTLHLPEWETILEYANTTETRNNIEVPKGITESTTCTPKFVDSISASTEEKKQDTIKITDEIKHQALTPLFLTEATSNTDMYSPEAVNQHTNVYGDGDGNLALDDLNNNPPDDIDEKISNPSRHYHQRLGGYTKNDVLSCLTRLGITDLSEKSCTTFGGYTGEYSELLDSLGIDVTFTEPNEDWVDRIENSGIITKTINAPLSALPSHALDNADFISSFECYHGIYLNLQDGFYDLLRILVGAEHGLVFAQSEETREQMRNGSNVNKLDIFTRNKEITQFKSRYRNLTDTYDATTQFREKGKIRLWQTKGDTEVNTEMIIDLLTIQSLLATSLKESTKIGNNNNLNQTISKYIEEIKSNPPATPKTDLDITQHYDTILSFHPVCETKEQIFKSIGRIKTTIGGRETEIQIGETTYKLSRNERDMINI